MSTIGAQTLASLDITIPPAGSWFGEVVPVNGDAPAPGPCTITIGDLILLGTVVRSGLDSPSSPRVVVAGGYGWRRLLPAPGGAYKSPTSVRLLSVLRDLAVLATYPGGPATGEVYVPPTDADLGKAYGWPAASPRRPVRARAILADLLARGAIPTWRVDPTTGATRFDAWPVAPEASGHVVITSRNAGRGIRMCALQNGAAALIPGGTLEGVSIARVTFTESKNELRAKVGES